MQRLAPLKHPMPADDFSSTRAFAIAADECDPLHLLRDEFEHPFDESGNSIRYFAGNSLGLMPKKAKQLVTQELNDWAQHGVDGHQHGDSAWYRYHELFRETGAAMVGAQPGETVMMNSLTVNLHLMLVSFYQPDLPSGRTKILLEEPIFPSDRYAIASHIRSRGLDPNEHVIWIRPRPNEHLIHTEDVEQLLRDHGSEIALVMLAGVNYFTGQFLEIDRITQAGHAAGCIVGWDLAHAVGNMPLELHEWGPDFAVWCSYKYLNSGPGAIAGCFIHQRHEHSLELNRYSGWWGNDPETRFEFNDAFYPQRGADGWQLSNPPILAMAPLRASLDLFQQASIKKLRAKSIALTGYLRWLLEQAEGKPFEIITPSDPHLCGCQLSLLVHDTPRERFEAVRAAHMVCDFRTPNVIRVAPTPLYNTFEDVWFLADVLSAQQATNR